MNEIPYLDLYYALRPFLMIVAGAFGCLAIDMASLRHFNGPITRNKTVGMLTVVALLAACVPVCWQIGDEPESLLGHTLVVNNLSLIFILVILAFTIITAVISMNSNIGGHAGEYYCVLLFAAVGMMVLVSSEELLTIFVALELTSICLYILTAAQKGVLRSQEAALKYFMFGAIASAFLLFGLSYVYGLAGTTDIRAIAGALGTGKASPLLAVALLFVLVGFGFKIAVVPFHLWAPDAYEGAPTPVIAYISTASKVASFFVLVKILVLSFVNLKGTAFLCHPASGWSLVLAVTGTASMIFGNVVAIVQRNTKRLLAYSSIAHAGYILIGLVAANETGLTAVLFYVIVYGLTNLGAFGVVAVLAEKAGGDDLEHMNGMARRAPFLSFLMLIFLLSLAGIPPLGGFFGKFYLFAAAVQRDSQNFGLLWLVVLGIVMSAVSLYYYLIFLKHMYVESATDNTPITTAPHLNAVLAAAAFGVVLFGLMPQNILELLKGLVGQL